jgi:hypothetical protein
MRKSFLSTLLTIPIVFESAISHLETESCCNLIGINYKGGFVIYNLLAVPTDQIDVLCHVRLITVSHPIKFQHFDYTMFREFIESGVDRR